jgi:hypothetical protein
LASFLAASGGYVPFLFSPSRGDLHDDGVAFPLKTTFTHTAPKTRRQKIILNGKAYSLFNVPLLSSASIQNCIRVFQGDFWARGWLFLPASGSPYHALSRMIFPGVRSRYARVRPRQREPAMEVALAILVIARDPNAQSKNHRRIALAVRRARKNSAPP